MDDKAAVEAFWQRASCGEEAYAKGDSERDQYEAQAAARFKLDPIFKYAKFETAKGQDVLEIGVGMGADHLEWARARPKTLTGIDLTQRAVDHTSRRLALYGLTSKLSVADAENLPFSDSSFDVVYSWGVLHHTPNTRRAVNEAIRVLRPGGRAVILIYHTQSIVGAMLWLRYAMLSGQPSRSLAEVYAQHLESPGTKAFSKEEARAMFATCRHVDVRVELGSGDLLEGAAGQRHPGRVLELARRVWPRSFIRKYLHEYGLGLVISASK